MENLELMQLILLLLILFLLQKNTQGDTEEGQSKELQLQLDAITNLEIEVISMQNNQQQLMEKLQDSEKLLSESTYTIKETKDYITHLRREEKKSKRKQPKDDELDKQLNDFFNDPRPMI